jgi:uncharacterized protein YraI
MMFASLALAPGVYAAPSQPATSNTATTTDALNLRAGPSLGDRVITVMPKGSQVILTGQSRNGFLPVTYSGLTGWAHSDYLKRNQTQPSPAGSATTTDYLNLRNGPSLGNRVLTVMPARAKVTLTGQISNGFRSVSYNGWTGWASAQYLAVTNTTPTPTGTATTTDALNLRSGPSTAYTVLAVMPSRARVNVLGQSSNGFEAVTYNGQRGWAFSQYLAYSSPPAPPPPPPDVKPPVKVAPFAATNPIIGPTRGSVDQVMGYAKRRGSQRMDDLRDYVTEIYRLAPQIGFDPAILIAQSELETNGWTSKWWVQRLNPAGLGITGDPKQELTSATFANGTLAARAQIAHMHAEVIGSAQALPDILQGVDATYQAPFRAGWAGTIRTIHDLAGTWAADSAYDTKIVKRANEIFT